MIPWVRLDTAQAPDGGSELRLMRRGSEFSIMVDNISLMNSRMSGSEEALATLSYERLSNKVNPHILIGGLGMGFTLRAALAVLGAKARVTVAELVPAVVAWARGPMTEVFGDCLSDPRVKIEVADVIDIMRDGKGRFDAILLDVDNGPDGLTQSSNEGLYSNTGLNLTRAALRPGGVLAVWSQGPDDAFARRFAKAKFTVEDIRVRATRSKRGSRHVIWLGTRNG